MSGWSPPSIPRPWLAVAVLLYVGLLAYSLVVVQQILLGILPGLVLAILYVGWRFLVAVEAIADGLHRLADQRDVD